MPTDIIVAGLGRSAQEFAPVSQNYVTIGVNDIDKFFAPTHLVVLDPARRFTDIRRDTICNTAAEVVWTTPVWPCFEDDPRRKKITTRRFDNRPDFDIDKDIPNSRTSPFAAIGLAYRLGAIRIGVIGMDLLSDHHMNKFVKQINEQLGKLAKLLLGKGVVLVNVSSIAAIHSIPTARLSYIQEKKLCQTI